MPISFDRIPSSLRDPGTYAEVDNSRALRGLPQFRTKVYFIGQKLAAGSATASTPILVNSVEQAKVYFGRGSQLAHMFEAFKNNTRYIETWALPLADESGGTQAAGLLSFTGPATANGTIFLYIAGRQVKIGVTSGDIATAVATAVVAAITAAGDLPITAAIHGSNAYQVVLTARHKGTVGNDIDVRLNYYGLESGEALPAGLACTITAMAAGATDPDTATAIAALPDEHIDYFVLGTHVAAEVLKLEAEMNDRWDYDRKLYCHMFTAKNATVGNLSTYGNARNNQHNTCFGYYNSPTPFYEWAAAAAAQISLAATNDPARPFQTLPLLGVLPAPKADQFSQPERETLLYDGIATHKVVNGVVQISRAITTYQTNTSGALDASYLDTETLTTLSYIIRTYISMFETKYPRHKLVPNGTILTAGQAAVTPNAVKADMVTVYRALMLAGIVTNIEQFKQELVCEINATDPNRLDVLFPPDLANQLRITALKVQYLL